MSVRRHGGRSKTSIWTIRKENHGREGKDLNTKVKYIIGTGGL